ncbi:(2Fe-2S)-binding protein [Cohnella endophytica]|uniref:(2Fe-2S)-binding protein n=1 Tax=Cohnella endophytica TaxID=2419778 RepID=UPI001F490405|nr:(2Fe-2S)-binding protein [Cohnella endophytica]
MSYGRIENHPILGPLPETRRVCFLFDGRPIEAREGESIAAALLANGIRTLRAHEEQGTPRGIYCNIGHCMECRITIEGVSGFRACLSLASDGLDVCSGIVLPTPFQPAKLREGDAYE